MFYKDHNLLIYLKSIIAIPKKLSKLIEATSKDESKLSEDTNASTNNLSKVEDPK